MTEGAPAALPTTAQAARRGPPPRVAQSACDFVASTSGRPPALPPTTSHAPARHHLRSVRAWLTPPKVAHRPVHGVLVRLVVGVDAAGAVAQLRVHTVAAQLQGPWRRRRAARLSQGCSLPAASRSQKERTAAAGAVVLASRLAQVLVHHRRAAPLDLRLVPAGTGHGKHCSVVRALLYCSP